MHATLPRLNEFRFPGISRRRVETLQVNLGYKCNQACLHCHVNAGPTRTEMMDEEFVKAWGLYLYGSVAAFNSGELQLFQVVFNHSSSNNVPWSRHYIYDLTKNKTAARTKLNVVPLDTE